MRYNKGLIKRIFIPIGLGVAEFFMGTGVFLYVGSLLIPRLEQGGLVFIVAGFPMAIYGLISGILLFYKSKNQKKLSSPYAIIGGTIGAFAASMSSFLNFMRFFTGGFFIILLFLFMAFGHVIGLQSRKIRLWALSLSIIFVALLSIYFYATVEPL